MRAVKPTLAAAIAVGVLAGSAVGVTAQEAETAEGAVVEVTSVEYDYAGLPTSVPAGTTLTFSNEGAEVHEMSLARVADGTTESLEELRFMMALGRDLLADGFVETVGDGQPIVAFPGQTADDSFTLDLEGRYVVLCFIPIGMEGAKLEEFGIDISTLGPDTDISTLSPEAQAFIAEVSANPPHVSLGMVQEFTVTAAGTEFGPSPELKN